jgi:hypothetical protein
VGKLLAPRSIRHLLLDFPQSLRRFKSFDMTVLPAVDSNLSLDWHSSAAKTSAVPQASVEHHFILYD